MGGKGEATQRRKKIRSLCKIALLGHVGGKSSVQLKGLEKSKSGNQEKEVFGNSISDTDIKWRNWMMIKKEAGEIVKEVWDFAKELGVVRKGNEDEAIHKLEELEHRDHVVAGREDVECVEGGA